MKFLNNNRRGMALFLVIGVIVLLSIMIMSYNYLVRGKFNEAQNILMRAQSMKAAQAAAEYLLRRLIAECAPLDSENPSNSEIRACFMRDGSKIGDTLTSWANKNVQANGLDLAQQLFEKAEVKDNVSNLSYEVKVSILNQLQQAAGTTSLYFPFEKCGYIIAKCTIELEKSQITEIWAESRPFRVIVPVPVPITKFTLYVKDAAKGGSYKFNRVQIDKSGTGELEEKIYYRPLCLNNGSPSETEEGCQWKNRGWVYMGGGKVFLNRMAGGYKKEAGFYGQDYCYFNSEAQLREKQPKKYQFPETLTYDLELGELKYKCKFSTARWGFLNKEEYNGYWKKFLGGLYEEEYPLYPLDKEEYWHCSCLQLMGGEPGPNFEPTPTRVAGNVYDRFVNIAYLGRVNETRPLAVLKYVNEDEYNRLKQEDLENSTESTQSTQSSENNPNDQNDNDNQSSENKKNDQDDKAMCSQLLHFELATNTYKEFGESFKKLFTDNEFFPSESEPEQFAYGKIMSNVTQDPYNSTANLIIQYQTSGKKGIPPQEYVPKCTDYDFSCGGTISIDNYNDLPNINELASDNTLGMNKRVCYLIENENPKEASEVFKALFIKDNKLDLANSVVKIKTKGCLKLPSPLCPKSGGAIIANGPIEVPTFNQHTTPHSIVILAEKGSITVCNAQGADRSTHAYLIALGEGGELKYESSKLNLIGGAALCELNPKNIRYGGSISYDSQFDPTQNGFIDKHLSIVIGPKGAN